VLFKNKVKKACEKRALVLQKKKNYMRNIRGHSWNNDEKITYDANQWISSAAQRATKRRQDKVKALLQKLEAQMERDRQELKPPIIFLHKANPVA